MTISFDLGPLHQVSTPSLFLRLGSVLAVKPSPTLKRSTLTVSYQALKLYSSPQCLPIPPQGQKKNFIVGREGFEPPMLLIKRADLQSASFNHLDTCPKLSLVYESSNFSVGYHLCIAGLPAIAFSNAGPIVIQIRLYQRGTRSMLRLCFIPCMIPTFVYHNRSNRI